MEASVSPLDETIEKSSNDSIKIKINVLKRSGRIKICSENWFNMDEKKVGNNGKKERKKIIW